MALCDGDRAVPLPLAQDHKRIGEGDTGPEHRRDGRLRPGADRRTTPTSSTATFVQPVLDHLAARRHAVRRRALRRADAHRRRPAAARVQLPLRRPRDPGRAAPARRPTSPRSRSACTPRPRSPSRRSRWRDGRRAPSSPPRPATRRHPPPARPSRDSGADTADAALVFHAGVDAAGAVTGGRVLAVTGLGDDLAAAATHAYDGWRRSASTACRCAATSAGGRSAPSFALVRGGRRRHRRGQRARSRR